MEYITIVGSVVVTLALASYSIGILTEQRKKKITKMVLTFLTSGIILDITATACMIIGSSNSPFTFHGFVGYSALVAMLIDAFLIWKSYNKNGINCDVEKGLHLYSRYAYVWWVAAYITGALLVAVK